MEERRDIFLWVLLVLSGAAFYYMMYSGYGWRALQQKQAARDEAKAVNEEILRQNQDILRTIDRLKHDPAYVERVARKDFGMVGKDELIYQFDNSKDVETAEIAPAGPPAGLKGPEPQQRLTPANAPTDAPHAP
jgi:cell division protein FtsB